jgi:type I restriction enzyme S subunit
VSNGRYRAYPDYKKSGTRWLGDLPSHWNAKRLGQFFEERREKVSDTRFAPLSVTMQGIVPQLETAAKTDDGDNRKLVRANDFVINSRSDRKGSAGVSQLDGSVSLISTVLTPRNIEPRFVHHLLRSYPFQEEYYRFGKGIVADLWSTSYAEMKNILIPEIPLPEQTQIAAFLDHETAKIDRLIEKQEALIRLLKEKRQAVISHAVTKGLNPHAPLKDSGIEWLGQIPVHWGIIYLTHIVDQSRRIMYGIVLPGPDVDVGVPIVKGGDVKPGRLTLASLCKTTFAIESGYARSRLKAGDLVYSIRGTIGDVEIVPEEIEGANLTQDAARIAPANASDNRWLRYTLESTGVFSQLEIGSLGAAVRGINIRDLKKAIIPLPPERDRIEIAEYIGTRLAKLETLSKKAELQVTLLQERRTALISAAVTGKIDVRHWQPPVGSETGTPPDRGAFA